MAGLYFGKNYTAAVSGTSVKQVHCEQCGCDYFYRMVRRGEGRGTSPYYLDNKGAQRRAERNAQRKLEKLLRKGIDPVPCPDCGWFQRDMVREVRRRSQRWLLVIGICFAILF